MQSKAFRSTLLSLFAAALLLPAVAAAGNPVGTWILTVEFPGQAPIKEILTLHHGGTVSDTIVSFRQPETSDGFGTWKRGPGNTVVLRFVKLTYFTGEHDGYIVLRAVAEIDGDDFTSLEAQLEYRVGTDFDAPIEIQDWDELFGMPVAWGPRLQLD